MKSGWDPTTDPLLGAVIDGRYEVLRVIGEGGMGTVYEVRHQTLERRFAMKVLRADLSSESQLAARFVREAKAAAAVSHTNVVQITDFGSITTGQPYFVMEMLEGEPLRNLLRGEQSLPLSRAAAILVQISEGLLAAHNSGVVHRDLKPDNILVCRDSSGRDLIKVLDFGLAKVAGQSRLTKGGMVFGTPHYMSPEQASGGELDHRSDMYSFGVVMYEVFTGRVPFEADTFMGVMTQHMYVQPTPPREIVDGTELGVLEDITLRCLEKNPKERYPSMQDVSADLRRAVTVSSDGIVVVRPSTRGVSPPVQSVLAARAGARGADPLPLDPYVPRRMTVAVATVAGVGLAALLLAWLGKDAPSDSSPGGGASQSGAVQRLRPSPRPSAAVPKVEAPPLVSATGTAAPGQSARRAATADETGGSSGPNTVRAGSSKVRQRPGAKTAPLVPKRDKKPKSLGQTSGGEIIDPWSRRASVDESPTR